MVILYLYLFAGFIVILRSGMADVLAKSFRELVLEFLARPERRQKIRAICAGLPLFFLLCIIYYILYPAVLFTSFRNRRRARRAIPATTGIPIPYRQQMPGYPPIYHN
jgi:hypothetical protein